MSISSNGLVGKFTNTWMRGCTLLPPERLVAGSGITREGLRVESAGARSDFERGSFVTGLLQLSALT